MLCTCSQSRMLVNHIVKLHAECHAEQLRKGFEGVCSIRVLLFKYEQHTMGIWRSTYSHKKDSLHKLAKLFVRNCFGGINAGHM